MAFPHMAAGGHFKAPAASDTFNHGHASQMAHAAHNRLAAAKALSGSGLGGPPKIAAPPAAGGVMPPAPGGNFKANIAHATAARGVPVTAQHVHNAIDSLTQKGQLTPFQGNALKQHNGPLVGKAGMQTMHMIGSELMTNPQVRM